MHERTNIRLNATDRSKLEAVASNRNSPQKHVWRARIVPPTTDGQCTAEILRATGKAGSMAKAAGISVSSVQRIWGAHSLQPHRVRRFKLSNDPQFAAKLHEIVGLYLNPLDQAIVLSVDEKHPDVMKWLEKHRRLSSGSPRHPLPGSTLSRASLPSSKKSVSSTAYSDPCWNSKMPSTASSRRRPHQRKPKTLYLEQEPNQNYRRCQTWAPSVRINPLGLTRCEVPIVKLQRHIVVRSNSPASQNKKIAFKSFVSAVELNRTAQRFSQLGI
jgi:hypothetical protein